MKKGIALLLVAAHVTAVFHFTVPYLSYYANFTYFATEVCINKHNPELECNGSCQLEKMIHQDHQEDTKAPAQQAPHLPKIDFFFNKQTPSVTDDLCNFRPYAASNNFLYTLWQPEPLSPPPRHA